MNILHTSDWHLGRTLYGRKRHREFEAFLAWLLQTIQDNDIETLLVAGDIFDTSAPSNRAQELYYQFLGQVAASPCRHVVVVAGNHDSPSFLSAPKSLLKALDVHVVGSAQGIMTKVVDEEVLVLRDGNNAPELIVCAVPYLRDRDLRVAEAGESVEDKEQKLLEGIRTHYADVSVRAESLRAELGAQIPIVAMGHLFTAGGQTVEGDGVRELYVGSLAHVTAEIFSEHFNYTALGHLHVPQKVRGSEIIRYSGSPLALSFGEAKQQKSVCRVAITGQATSVQLLPVPVFQKLERITGDWNDISNRLLELSTAGSTAWIEVIFDDQEIMGDLRERLDAASKDTGLEILRVKNNRVVDRVLGQKSEEETLEDLNELEVFERCLCAREVPQEQRPELLRSYQETLSSLYEADPRAEEMGGK